MTSRSAAAGSLLLGALLAAGCGPRRPEARVRVQDARARPSAPGASAGAAYLTLTSAAGDRLVGVSVPPEVARLAQVHEVVRTRRGDGAAELGMRHVSVVDLPRGRPVVFAPGGLHVMLIALARPLVEGDSVRLALAFSRARPETVSVPVRDE